MAIIRRKNYLIADSGGPTRQIVMWRKGENREIIVTDHKNGSYDLQDTSKIGILRGLNLANLMRLLKGAR